MGRAAQGVRGMKLASQDRIVGSVLMRRDTTVCGLLARLRSALTEAVVLARVAVGTLLLEGRRTAVGEVGVVGRTGRTARQGRGRRGGGRGDARSSRG